MLLVLNLFGYLDLLFFAQLIAVDKVIIHNNIHKTLKTKVIIDSSSKPPIFS